MADKTQTIAEDGTNRSTIEKNDKVAEKLFTEKNFDVDLTTRPCFEGKNSKCDKNVYKNNENVGFDSATLGKIASEIDGLYTASSDANTSVATVPNIEQKKDVPASIFKIERNKGYGDSASKIEENKNHTDVDAIKNSETSVYEGDSDEINIACSPKEICGNLNVVSQKDNQIRQNSEQYLPEHQKPKNAKIFFIGSNSDEDIEENEVKRRQCNKTKIKKNVNWCNENEQEMELIKHERALAKTTSKIMTVLYILAFFNSFSFWLQSGVLPYLTRQVGMTPALFGLMESTYAFYQTITSPLFGRLGDIFGVRIIYMLSEFCASLTFGSLALANSIPALFLTRLPALLMHSVLCSYMIITDISTPLSRADLIGKLGVFHGFGMMFGSLIGGIITHAFNEKTAAVVAAISNIFSIIIIFCFIPENTKQISYQIKELVKTEPSCHDTLQEEEVRPSLSSILTVLKFKNIKFLLTIKILIAFPYSLLYSMFSMAIMDYYHLGPKINGLLLGYVGVLTILVQGVIVGWLSNRFTDPTNVKMMLFLNMVGFLFLVVADNVYILAVVIIPLAIGGTVSHIVLMAVITKIVPIKDTGTALGLTFALHAIVRALAPTLGGLMFTHLGWPFFGVIGYIFHFFLVTYVILWGYNEQYI